MRHAIYRGVTVKYGCLLLYRVQVELLHLLAGPGGGAQKLQGRLDAGVRFKAVDVDTNGEFLPAEAFLQLGYDCL